jgi:hypothetical protein
MKNHLALVFILSLPTVSHAGDLYGGFAKFAGQWKIVACTPKNEGTISDLNISLTETRNNAVNVYFLNSDGKNSQLHFSTAGILRTKGHILKRSMNDAYLIDNRSDETGIRVTLRDSNHESRIHITQPEPNQIAYERSSAVGTISCNFERSVQSTR